MSSTVSSFSQPSVKEDQLQPRKKQTLEDSSFSPASVKEDLPQPLKKQKLEGEDNKHGDRDVVDVDDVPSWAMLDYYDKVNGEFDDDDDDDDAVVEDSSDSESEIYAEEIRQYVAALKASEGFDVPSFPRVSHCIIQPVSLDDYTREILKPLCVAALNHYNEEKNTEYKFLKLEKATSQAACGLLYYLTFVGRISEDNTTQIFEANVLKGIPKNTTVVYFCREKTTPGKADV